MQFDAGWCKLVQLDVGWCSLVQFVALFGAVWLSLAQFSIVCCKFLHDRLKLSSETF